MNILQSILSLFRPKSPLQQELHYTKAALYRYQQELVEMTDDPDEDNWILGYYDLAAKIDRVSSRIQYLQTKLAGKA